MEVLNSDENIDMKVTSRYTIVIAASKRARQLVYGAEPLADAASDKAVSVAINEMAQGKVNICLPKQDSEGAPDSCEAGHFDQSGMAHE